MPAGSGVEGPADPRRHRASTCWEARRQEWTGRTLCIPRRQPRALLYRLGIRLEGVPRDELCFLFWPDVPNVTAHRNLSPAIHLHRRPAILRGSVGLGRVCGPGPALHLVRHRRIKSGCAPPPEHNGTWGEAGLLPALGRRSISTAAPSWRASLLIDSPDARTGPPGTAVLGAPLPGNAHRPDRRVLGARAIPAAVALAQRYLATDDLAPGVHRRLMVLFASLGERAAALRQFERLTAVLEQRTRGEPPSPDARRL